MFGRQSERITPDAGTTRYKYDKNGNLLYSQDANQRNIASNIYTYRKYDGLNRLQGLGVTRIGQGNINFGDIDPVEPQNPEDLDNFSVDSMLIVNVYDTISTSIAPIFNSLPLDYSEKINYTNGLLCATAYRDKITDSWNFKFYRYDARGRVKKMWSYISNLGWKTFVYDYNSQNQVTYINYNPGNSDRKLYWNIYDVVARLRSVNYYTGSINEGDSIPPGGDNPGDYSNLTSYFYDANSQVRYHNLNDSNIVMDATYNNRNWLQTANYKPRGSSNIIYRNIMFYNSNGNIRHQRQEGSYKSNFTDQSGSYLDFKYIYDLSNRLLKSDRDSGTSATKHDLINTYDDDGNLLTLKRYGYTNNLADDYNYQYFSGTNRLAKTTALGMDQYSYDYNGNETKDDQNQVSNMAYDYRNLLLSFRSIKTNIYDAPTEPQTYETRYFYDEAGNRIRKLVKRYIGPPSPQPEYNENDDPYGYWQTVNDEHYVRDVSGKEMAIYGGSNLEQWNLWGLDNFGKIDANNLKFFYLKDHLGTIHAIVNQNNEVVYAQDHDAWGYPLEGRQWIQASGYDSKYKFTSKERDLESNYDYFGARYYDARIGRWGGVEPKYDKYIGWTPYNYSLNNSTRNIDINGFDVIVTGSQSQRVVEELCDKTNLAVKIDDNGKLTAIGNPKNQSEYFLMNAINSKDITINLITTSSNSVTAGSETVDLRIGAFFGSEKNGEHVTATQIINLDQADVWEEAGGSDVAGTIMHEVDEAFIGAFVYPGSNFYNNSNNDMQEKYDNTHRFIKEFVEGNKQYYPGSKYYTGDKKMFLVDKDKKEHFLYQK